VELLTFKNILILVPYKMIDNNMAMRLKEGEKAPDFQGKDQDGKTVKLSDFAGKKLVLYFYPKDDTPGCTAESCNLRDNYEMLLSKGYAVLGISADDEKSHQKFIKKYNLPFSLLADTEKVIHEQFGTWGEKTMYGKTYMGTLRTTFVINEKGIIEEVIEKVDTKDHVKQIVK
jgi:peroxiredoxin Q/BCP